ncbi:MAG: efflux RND transporter periplasmic adaptor subunit [Balneolaceae bacterium]|nr:MAG: efflux RND transporter periplasmic adaptor subunit [Balneolaceae bacterium]
MVDFPYDLTKKTMRIYIKIGMIILALLLISGCSGSGEQTENRGGGVIPAVEAVQAQFGGLPLEERLNGIVRASNQVDIYPRIAAPIEEIFVQNGDQVREGEPLIRLRDLEYRERLRQAEASLRISIAQRRQAEAALGEIRSELRRARILAERELSSELEMEQLEARLESAEASLELAEAQVEQARSNVAEQNEALSQTVILSPVDGTIGQRAAEVGMQVNANTRLFTVGDLSQSRITINLTERMLGYVRTGHTARIFSENMPDTVLVSEISRISPFLGAGNFSTEAEIDIENAGGLLLPGMFVTVDVLYGESEQTTVVPLSALYRNPQTGATGVYRATGFGLEASLLTELDAGNEIRDLSNPTTVEFVPVDIVARGRDAAGVTGIRSGDWVVTVGQNLLVRDNSEVARVRPASWQNIMEMQRLRPQDLLREIMNDSNVANQLRNDTIVNVN